MKHVSLLDPEGDPFGERPASLWRDRFSVLGARFELDSNDLRALQLATDAYAGLPVYRLQSPQRTFHIALRVDPRATLGSGREPPPLRLHAANGLLSGTMDAANFAVLSPEQREGLVVFSRDMLKRSYHARYELLEFAVYTLAARALGLISLHAACIAASGRGVLLIGASGAGKSTLAMHCLRRGMELVSEDSTFVTPPRLSATGVPTFLHLRESALEWLPAREGKRLAKFPFIYRRSGIRKLEIDLRSTKWRMARAAPSLAAIVFLTKKKPSKRQGARLLARLSKQEASRRLASSQAYAAGRPGWTEFLKRATRLGAFELRRGEHPDEAVDELSELLTR